MIAVYTFAYNSSATLKRCVESILNQTYKNWVYYLADDGSDKDNTREMILEYAEKDSRIVPILLDENDPQKAAEICYLRIKESSADYFCTLDSDDEYSLDFFEKALAFAEEYSLDMVCGGSIMVKADTLEIIRYRTVEKNLFMNTPDEVNKNFRTFFHNSIMPIWGKLFKTDLIKKFDICNTDWEFYKISYNADVIFNLKLAEYTDRIGFFPGISHKYYIPNKVGQTASYTYTPTRFEAIKVLRNRAAEFLIKKTGYLSEYNEWVLNSHFLNQTQFTINLLVFSDIDLTEKLKTMRNILGDNFMLAILENPNIDNERRMLFYKSMLEWLSSLKGADKDADGLWLGMTLSSLLGDQRMYAAWSLFNISFLIENERFEEADEELSDWESLLPNFPDVVNLRNRIEQGKKSREV